MKVRVLFFGATADAIGDREIDFEFDRDVNSRQAFDRIIEVFPVLTAHKLLFSINQNYSRGDEKIREGDELAIFTAVSGG